MTRPRIYISGPLTSTDDVRENVRRAKTIARLLIAEGFSPLCPHLTYYLDQANEIAHAVWMEVDCPWVAVSDAVLRLPGESKGADIECEQAERSGVPVFFTIGDLRAAFFGGNGDAR